MLGQDWKTLLYSDCVHWFSSAIQRSAASDSDHRLNKQVTEHLNLTSGVSLRMLCFISRSGRCVKDDVSWCGLSPDSQQEPIHTVAHSVAESLKQALRLLTRDPWLLSFSEQLKTSAPCVWRKDMKARFGVLGVGSICVNVCIKYLMISMKLWRLWYVLCVWDIKVWEVSVSDCGFDKAYGFLSVHICRLW